MTQTVHRLQALEAFCQHRPAADEVHTVAQTLGFHLVFQLPAHTHAKRGMSTLPPMPAQYHYRDDHGTDLIYLAGQDRPADDAGMLLPPHASRWWLYPGANTAAYQHTVQRLSRYWSLSWRPSEAA